MKNAFYYLIILAACSNPKNGKLSYDQNDESFVKNRNEIDSMKTLQGIWAEDSISSAYFLVKGDSIQSVDDVSGLYCYIRKDTLVVNYDWGIMKYRILKMSNDSLLVRNEDNSIVKLYKR